MHNLLNRIIFLTLFTSICFSTNTRAAKYTAIASGSFSSATTWQGNKSPSIGLLLGDTITIPNGFNVVLGKQPIGIGSNSVLEVNGTLSGGGGSFVMVEKGVFKGAGTISVDSFISITLTGLTFTGQYDVSNLRSHNAMFAAGADVHIKNGLVLDNGTTTLASGKMHLDSGATIHVVAGVLKVTGGTLDLTKEYHVWYSGAGVTAGLELDGAGLTNIRIQTKSSGSRIVKLSKDVTMKGELDFIWGKLDVDSYKLTLEPSATITNASQGNYVITSSGGRLSRNVKAGASVHFPVGNEYKYYPVLMTSSGNTDTRLDVGMQDDVKANGTGGASLAATQPVVDATWFIESSVNSSLDFEMEVFWINSSEVNNFDRNNAYLSHYTNAQWDKQPYSQAGTSGVFYSISRKGIKSFSPFAVFGTATTGVGNVSENNLGLKMYPNPVSKMLYMRINAKQAAVYNVYNTTGQKVKAGFLENGQAKVNVSTLGSGVYFVEIKTDNNVYRQQFVKQ